MGLDSKHINAAFDQDLDHLLTQLMAMGGLVENSIRESSRALLTLDGDLADQVINDDNRIDVLQDDIHKSAVNCIALRQPQASDLRMVIAAMGISNSLERAADHSKNTAKRISSLIQSPPLDSAKASLQRLTSSTQTIIKDSLDAFIQNNVELAAEVIIRDQDIDEMFASLFREYLTYMLEDPKIITPTMHLLFIAKNVERIGDHATSIAEQTIYLITGSFPEGERPKGDNSVYYSASD